MDGGNIFLGIDLGIGSCGWALATDTSVIALGARTFDVPETDKTRTPTNQLRRTARGLRRVTNRRRQRMNMIRELLNRYGILDQNGKDALTGNGIDPWQSRAEGLDRVLAPREIGVALGHIAKHRGFKSNSKRDKGENAPQDSSKMLAAVTRTKEALSQWRSVGELFWKSSEYKDRKRNRDNDYSRSILRADLEAETQLLLRRQRELGNLLASVDLERDFIEVAFFQRPLADSEDKVGFCPFEPAERRAPKHSPSFELFRLLSRLTSIRIDERSLSAEEISAAIKDFGSQQGMTFKRLRKILDLSVTQRFQGVAVEDEDKRDVATRSGKMSPGSAALRKVLKDQGWQSLRMTPDILDQIAAVLAFRDDAERIRTGLEELALPNPILVALIQGVEDGAFGGFRGAGHISAKACRALIPHLARGMVYSEACKAAGYDHATRTDTVLEAIANPIARKSLTEALKQIRAVINTYGMPTHIHVELARDVGKSLEERQEIEAGIEKRNKEKDRIRLQFVETVGREASGPEDLLRYELWKEQNGRCLYTDQEIHPDAILSTDNRVQVDHILPWSRSGDDSFVNKTLCWAKANQDKKGQTPFEWFGDEADRWQAFTSAVEGCHAMKGRKKRNFLLKDASVLEEKFRSRNLNDTRYATRLLLNILKRDNPHVTVAARPGPLTDRLRRAWGIQSLKKAPDGKRLDDDRHHALDAVIVALTSESVLQRLTKLFQEAETRGLPTNWHGIGHLAQLFRETGGLPADFIALEQPWSGFRAELSEALQKVTVSRAERCRARGEAHAATIRQVRERDGQSQVYERKAIDKLTEKDLDRVKDAERNAALVASLRTWIADGKPKSTSPLSPKGDPIRKVRLETTKKVDVEVRGGAADRGEMARVDVFRKQNKKGKWEYFLVPIYPHQVANQEEWPQPPSQAVAAHKAEDEWPEMDADYEFLWSINPFCWIEVEKVDGTFIGGYFRGMDRGSGNIEISPHYSKAVVVRGIGARTLASFQKYAMDRLGNRYEIVRETRTWHGAVCT
jgi:CRISPR-associated endonuclease Csn1